MSWPPDPVRLGVVLPSSNTVAERVLARLLGGCAGVSLHCSRFALERLARDSDAVRSFSADAVVAAAELLSHAEVDAIAYCGVSGSWLGLEHDEAICDRVAARFHVPACTATLATLAALEAAGVSRIGLVKAGPPELAEQAIATFEAHGLRCDRAVSLPAERNTDLAQLSTERLEAAARLVAGNGAEAVCILGTNLLGAPLVERLEAELGLLVVDSVLATAWRLCALTAVTPEPRGWGSLMAIGAAL